MDPVQRARLLPWTGPEGRPCYLLTDGTGQLSRVADRIEAVQLGMGGDLLAHALALLAEGELAVEELRVLAGHLTEALRDVLRIAESRGARLR
ncbi:hypothetical protein GCM10020367_27000 [Streptomyces sannanensis]|uniref:PqqD family protein n=1 Tax=Streptomyces sannanensis TaxID=285536 RepID=A0ABP6SB94_9ACTN